MDPLAGSSKDENGSIVHTITQNDMDRFSTDLNDESVMRAQYERAKQNNEVWDLDEEDELAFRQGLLQELEDEKSGINVEDFDKVMDKELGSFLNGKYDYVRDLKDAYKNSLR